MAADIMSRLQRPCASGVLLSLLVALIGCTGQKIKTHPVVGTVVLNGGDVSILKRSIVEFMDDTDSAKRSSGAIGDDGGFELKTFHGSDFVTGAPEGTYKVRIVLADPNDEGVPKRTGNPVHPRHLDFNASGLKVTVPSSDYTLSLSK